MPDNVVPLVCPNLPPLDEIIPDLTRIWNSGIMTHHGPFEKLFEKQLSRDLDVMHAMTCANGTVAIELALTGINSNGGEIITTPFSWISSATSIINKGFKPKFVDIDPYTLNISIPAVEKAISKSTVAILGVHTFGNPCDIDALSGLSEENNIKLIFDAAHAMGSTYNGKSVLCFGDVSATSFHATKIVSCGEGGAVFTNRSDIAELIKQERFFGYDEARNLQRIGRNAKFNEISAVIANASYNMLDDSISHRKYINDYYRQSLKRNGIKFQSLSKGTNYSYFPIIFDEVARLIEVMEKLQSNFIQTRRYFYPLLSKYRKIAQYSIAEEAHNASHVADRILILPCHKNISEDELGRVSDLINE